MSLFDSRTHPELLQVDVFSDIALSGNAAAVVFGAEGFSDATLQAIARETNLSETVFILAPQSGGDYRARIFTTRREIPFAGHPTLAATHAYAQMSEFSAGLLKQECGAGIISVTGSLQQREWFVALPQSRITSTSLDSGETAQLFGLDKTAAVSGPVEIAAAGVPWLMLELVDTSALAMVKPDFSKIAAATRVLGAVGITIWSRNPETGIDARLRTFAPAEGIYEDPVCGSCAGALAALLLRESTKPQILTFEQGIEIGRKGTMTVRKQKDGGLVLGGICTTVLKGHLDLGSLSCV